MRIVTFSLVIAVCGLFASPAVRPAEAALTAEQRKELADVRQDVNKVASLLREKKTDEAEKLLQDAEGRLQKIVEADKQNERDRGVQILQRQILMRRGALLKQKAGEDGISFQSDVAPILKKNCLSCHAGNPKGGLRLDTFAGLKRGGQSARRRIPLIVPGTANRSLLMARLTAPENRRMPKGRDALSPTEIQTIALWIEQGAKFDGDDETASIGETATKEPPKKPRPKVTVARATGDEKVSFKRDIAPFMVNICLRCHGGNNPRSGFSVETFEKLLQGGDSGEVIVPGDLEASRLWDLVGKQDPIKMPPGQLLITRSNWRNLKTWIEEGAKFDGKDPRAPLRSLVPTEAEKRAAELAAMDHEELLKLRRERSDAAWEQVLPKEKPQTAETAEFLVYGNVSTVRLEEVGKWAEEHAQELRRLFDEQGSPLFKGKLTIFVMKDRFGYEEFNYVVHRRETPREMTGHSVLAANFEDAYIVLQDVGDEATRDSPGLRVNLVDHLTGAFMKRGGDKLPDWLLRGTGLMLAARADSKNEYLRGARDRVPGLLRRLARPEDVFADGTFSPADAGPVGYSLVEFLWKAGGSARFGQFISAVQQGRSVAEACKLVYRAEPKALAQAYVLGVAKRGRTD